MDKDYIQWLLAICGVSGIVITIIIAIALLADWLS